MQTFNIKYDIKLYLVYLDMLQTKSLNVEVEHKSILSDLSVSFDLGKNYCILGKNGS